MLCFNTFSRQRAFVCSLILCAALALFGLLHFLPSPRAWNSPFPTAYQRVTPGMTMEEVAAILGQADHEGDGDGRAEDFAWTWVNGWCPFSVARISTVLYSPGP
jgi:hypothetical protein